MTTNEGKTIKHIAILFAMKAEADPFIKSLNLEPVPWKSGKEHFLPSRAYQGQLGDGMVTVVVNGKDKRFGVDSVGTTPAALAAFSVITDFQPDIMVSAGVAGGFKHMGGNIGDCYIGTSFAHHDRRIVIPDTVFGAYGVGLRHGPQCTNMIIANLQLKSGVVSTGNSLKTMDLDPKLIQENRASVKDMEAAGIACVTDHAEIPLIAVKVVTHLVDGEELPNEEFLPRLEKAAETTLLTQLTYVVNYMMGKLLSEL